MRLLFEGGHYLRAGFIFFIHVAEKDGNSECCKMSPRIKCVWTPVNDKELCDNNNHNPA